MFMISIHAPDRLRLIQCNQVVIDIIRNVFQQQITDGEDHRPGFYEFKLANTPWTSRGKIQYVIRRNLI